MAVVTFTALSVSAENPVEINIELPGTLYETILNRDDDHIPHLVITGKLNTEDLKSLHQPKGVLSTVEILDISGVTVEENAEEPYARISVDENVEIYLYSAEESRYLINEHPDWVVPGYNTYVNKTTSLAGLFAGDACQYSVVLMPEVAWPERGALTSNSNIQKIVYSRGCTEIGVGAFDGCAELTEMVLPQRGDVKVFGDKSFRNCAISDFLDFSPESIGNYAFEKSSVSSIDLSNVTSMGNFAFDSSNLTGEIDLHNLKNIPIMAFRRTKIAKAKVCPEIETIGMEAFFATQLEDIELPSSLRSVGKNAFQSTPFFTNFEKNNSYENGILYLGGIAYMSKSDEVPENVVIKEGCTSLASSLFDSQNIKSVQLPSTIKGISDEAFYGCKELKSINFPEGLLSIGKYALSQCEALSTVELPVSLEIIAEGAFNSCSAITSIKLHSNLREIGYSAFKECSALDRVYFDCRHLVDEPFDIGINNASKLTVGPNAEWLPGLSAESLMIVDFEPRENDSPFSMAGNCFINSQIKSIVLPASTTSIPTGCFDNCKTLKSVKFEKPAMATDFIIGENAFRYSSALEYIELPQNLVSIGDFAFYDSGLKSIDLPEGLRSVGFRAFSGALNDQEMLILPSTLQEFSGYAFYEMGIKGISIPKELAGNSGLVIYECPNLKTVVVKDGAEELAFSSDGYLYEIPESVRRISGNIGVSNHEVVMPDNLEEISGSVNLSGVEKVSLPHKCLSITGSIQSEDTYKLEWRIPVGYEFDGDPMNNRINRLGRVTGELVIPEGVGILGCSFDYEYSHYVTNGHLDKITLPSTLKYIHNKSFYGCLGWTEITCYSKTPPELYGSGSTDYFSWDNSYSVILKGNLYVPAGSAKAYRKNPAWARFEIYELPDDSGVKNIDVKNSEDIDFTAPYDIYNMQGVYVGVDIELLNTGLYIIRQGATSVKIKK